MFFYWYQIFAIDSAVVEVQEMFSSHGGHLTNAMQSLIKKGNDQEFIQINSISCSCSFHSRLFRSGAIGPLHAQEIAALQKIATTWK